MQRESHSRSRVEFAVVIGLLSVLAVQLWSAAPSVLPTAQAQIPDTGLQRKQLIDEARRTNELLTDILTLLREKPIKVEVASPEKGRGGLSRDSQR